MRPPDGRSHSSYCCKHLPCCLLFRNQNKFKQRKIYLEGNVHELYRSAKTLRSCFETHHRVQASARAVKETKSRKSRQLDEDIVPTLYRSSIDNDDVENLIAAEWIEASSVDGITEQQAKQCVEDRCRHNVEGEKLYLLEEAVRSVTMSLQIADTCDREWTIRREYYNELRNAGYGEVYLHKPHIAIELIFQKLNPHELYERMMFILKCRKKKNFERKN